METTFEAPEGQSRKYLAEIIGTILGGMKPSYQGAPTMAYKVGPVELKRDWTVSWPDEVPVRDVEMIEDIAKQEGYKATRNHDPAEAVSAEQGLTFTFSTEGWGERTATNLIAMLASKHDLVVKALEIPANPMNFGTGEVSFPWFTKTPDPEVAEAAEMLLTGMIEASKKAKRVALKKPSGDNEKYQMRCFLLRLGFIGDEYKDARRVLLRNLEGNAA